MHVISWRCWFQCPLTVKSLGSSKSTLISTFSCLVAPEDMVVNSVTNEQLRNVLSSSCSHIQFFTFGRPHELATLVLTA
jgi:hypothetical protein